MVHFYAFRAINIKSLSMKNIDGLKTQYDSSKDHSKWVITDTSSVPWTCIGDINRAVSCSSLMTIIIQIYKFFFLIINNCIIYR